MITDRDKEHIAKLIKRYGNSTSTDELLALIAENSGMLEACMALVQDIDKGLIETRAWVGSMCRSYNLVADDFVQEIRQILNVFKPVASNDKLYALLELEPDASLAEIKQQYRKLCRKYHPDAAQGESKHFTEIFIAITQAYHALLQSHENEDQLDQVLATRNWRRPSGKKVSGAFTGKNAIGLVVIALSLVVISLLITRAYNTQVMLNGLRNKGTAFIPPRKNASQLDEEAKTPLPQASRDGADSGVLFPKQQPEESVAVKDEHQSSDSPLTLPPTPTTDIPAKESAPSGEGSLTQVKKTTDISASVTSAATPEPREIHPARNKPPSHTPVGSAPFAKQAPTTAESARSTSRIPSSPAMVVTTPVHHGSDKRTSNNQGIDLEKLKNQKVTNNTFEDVNTVPPAKKNQTGEESLAASSRVLPLDSVPVTSPSEPEITQDQIDTFLQGYSHAYRQKNMASFSAFFMSDASENGKSLKEILPTYSELFNATKKLQLDIRPLKWQKKDSAIDLQGRFSIALTYLDERAISGRGSISFLLVPCQGKLCVQSMSYTFDH